jgi:Domain of unknown function (DUF4328)
MSNTVPWYRVGAPRAPRFAVYGLGMVASVLVMVAALARAVAVVIHAWTSYRSVVTVSAGVGIGGYADEIRAIKGAAIGLVAASAVLVVSGVVFIVWLYRARANAEASEVRLRLGRGWTIGAWFVPLANLVLPWVVVSDVWRASAPIARRGAGLVTAWWAAVLAAWGLDAAVMVLALTGDDAIAAVRTGAVLSTVEGLVTVLAAGLIVAVVMQISGWQRGPANERPTAAR